MLETYQGVSPVIDPTAFVHERATVIGKVTVGPESSVWPGVVMRGDDGRIMVGAKSSIQDGTVVHLTHDLSESVIGDRVTVGHNVIVHGCQVEDDVIVGMGSILLDNCRIGKGTIVGAGTLVPMNKTVPSNVLILGNPFRVVRELTEKDHQFIAFSWMNYVEKAKTHRTNIRV